MKIEVRFRGQELPSGALRDHATRRIHLHLSRFGKEIASVQVRVGDVNGPKGGLDKECQVTLRGRRIGGVIVDDVSSDAYAAVDLAVERAGYVVGRELERVRAERNEFRTARGAS